MRKTRVTDEKREQKLRNESEGERETSIAVVKGGEIREK